MKDGATEGRKWLDQAENELDLAENALSGALFHQVCHVAHQSAEKALRALHLADGEHNASAASAAELLAGLLERRPQLEPLRVLVAELDPYCVPPRDGNHLAFTGSHAERALEAARTIVDAARRALHV
jgi:HEPN domain-containing protein